MILTRATLQYIVASLMTFFLTACAPNFTTQSILEQRAPDRRNAALTAPKGAISRLQVNLGTNQSIYNNQTLALRHSFANALFNSGLYSSVLDTLPSGPLAPDIQSFDIVITPSFVQNIRWIWYLGVLTPLGPFWHLMPHNGFMELQADIRISQGGVLLQKLSMTERDTFDLFWYGAYRFWDLQSESDFLYRKLLGRLTSMLSEQASSSQFANLDASGVTEEPESIVTPMATPKKLGIAIMDPECHGIDSSTCQILNSKLHFELFQRGHFQILERDRMNDILAEQGFQQSGACDNSTCYVQMGQLVGVEQIFVASYGKIGERFLLTLRAISVATGNVIEEASTELEGDVEILLTQGIPELVRKLRLERIN
jgi:hypothetical protein